MPHPCNLSHYLIGNATIIPNSRIQTYSYVLTPISMLNISFHMLVWGEKNDDNAATILAMHLIYGWDASGAIGYSAPLKAMTKVGPSWGSKKDLDVGLTFEWRNRCRRSGWGSLRFGNLAFWNRQKKKNHPFWGRLASATLPGPKEAHQWNRIRKSKVKGAWWVMGAPWQLYMGLHVFLKGGPWLGDNLQGRRLSLGSSQLWWD
jgi:hypothetical protein